MASLLGIVWDLVFDWVFYYGPFLCWSSCVYGRPSDADSETFQDQEATLEELDPLIADEFEDPVLFI